VVTAVARRTDGGSEWVMNMDGRASSGSDPGRPAAGPNGAGPNGAGPAGRPAPDRGRPARRAAEQDELPTHELPTHPLRTGPIDPPPPAREQLPLPRRREQAHLEPQLRTPGGAGSGTPFGAFTATEPGPVPPADRDLPTAFRDGSRRARSDVRRHRRSRE
jgi:hypothetical protein